MQLSIQICIVYVIRSVRSLFVDVRSVRGFSVDERSVRRCKGQVNTERSRGRGQQKFVGLVSATHDHILLSSGVTQFDICYTSTTIDYDRL